MKKSIAIITLIALFVAPITASAAVKAGATCSKLGATAIVAGKKYMCVQSGKKLVWNKGLTTAKPQPTPTGVGTRILSILKPAGGVNGIYLKRVNGAIISNYEGSYAFEPASSLKTLISLYAFDLISKGKLKLADSIPSILNAPPSVCPNPNTNGNESVSNAIKQMMQFSDNNRTTALMEYFGVDELNNFAKTSGLNNTSFGTINEFPGFVPMGCVGKTIGSNPNTVHGNFSTLGDLTKLWELADSLQFPYRGQFMKLTAGKEMFEMTGSDFSGIWPSLENIVRQEAPFKISKKLVNDFIGRMQSNSKGGNDAVCISESGCSNVRWWLSIISLTKLPTCNANKKMSTKSFVWGYFVAKADSPSLEFSLDNPTVSAFLKVRAEPMREQIHTAIGNWAFCNSR